MRFEDSSRINLIDLTIPRMHLIKLRLLNSPGLANFSST
jgi:hypothetical protein